MLKHWGGLCRRVFLGKSVGFTLVEILVAVVLMAIVVSGVLMAMTVVFKQEARQDQQRTAEYLTRSEFEYIKTQPYIWGNVTGNATQPGYPPHYLTVPNTLNYTLDVVAIPIDNSTYMDLPTLPPDYQHVADQGIQKIIISVYSGSKTSGTAPVLVTNNYKVYRWEGQ
jgi:prepilin-type N-terminal cleavage/methylation domain-containing protein